MDKRATIEQLYPKLDAFHRSSYANIHNYLYTGKLCESKKYLVYFAVSIFMCMFAVSTNL